MKFWVFAVTGPKSFFQKNVLIEYEFNGVIKKGKIIGLSDYERFQILNLGKD